MCRRAVDEKRWQDRTRLLELSAPSCCKTWLWALNRHHGACLEPPDFAIALRAYLGADQTAADVPCQWCGGRHTLSGPAYHCYSCAGAAEVEGHNKIRDAWLDLASTSDPAACIEPAGLLTCRSKSRPADLLTVAGSADGGCECLDVGVASPFAQGAGACCLAHMRSAKHRRLGQEAAAELQAQRLRYVPLPVSAFGRLGADADERVSRMARRAARARGLGDHRLVERRFRQRLAVEVWRRTVTLFRRCLAAAALPHDASWEAALAGA